MFFDFLNFLDEIRLVSTSIATARCHPGVSFIVVVVVVVTKGTVVVVVVVIVSGSGGIIGDSGNV